MHPCSHCEGFIPAQASQCPNCHRAPQRGLKRGLKRAFQLMLGASFTMTLAACYGAPPPMPLPPCDDTAEEVDKPCTTPSPSPSPSASAAPSATPSPSASPSAAASPTP
jgi:hypothetical protein